MMQHSIQVGTVDTDTEVIVKAKVTITEDLVVVTDRRGQVLAELVPTSEPTVVGSYQGVRLEHPTWTFATAEFGQVTITNTGGCGCGGTQVTSKEQ